MHRLFFRPILQQYVLDASVNGLYICVHAIGEDANRKSLDMFEHVSKTIKDAFAGAVNLDNNEGAQEDKDAVDFRFRIEHAQHIHPTDIGRFSSLGVIASMQMSHLADDGRWATDYIGKCIISYMVSFC